MVTKGKDMNIHKLVPVGQQPTLAKYQPCGCVICTCEHETQCRGCGAKHCGTHLVGQIPGPVYQQPAPDVARHDAMRFALSEMVKWYENISLGNNPAFQYYNLAKKALLSAAPQPAEQQPVYQRCEYCDGTGDVHSIDGEWRGACDCQPPAPNVAGLVEALEEIAKWTERWTAPDHPITTVARKALAAHRKGGDV